MRLRHSFSRMSNATANNSESAQNQGQSFRGKFPPRGRFSRGGGSRGGCENTQCQICHRFGHDASYYYHQFNAAYGASAYGAPNTSSYSGNLFQYVRPSISNTFAWPQAQFPPRAQAHLTNPYVAQWTRLLRITLLLYHHLLALLLHLIWRTCSLEMTKVFSFIQSFIFLPFPHSTLHLKNVIHVPSLNKNLISVSKYAYDNNAYVQVYPLYSTILWNLRILIKFCFKASLLLMASIHSSCLL